MLRIIAFLLCILPAVAFSQPGPSRERRLSLDVPFLTSGSSERDASPIIRFDKRILITSSLGPFTCLYLNTKNGDRAVSIDRDASACLEPFNINDEKFNLLFFSQSGVVIKFFNRKNNGRIEHYKTSGGTQYEPITFDSGSELLVPSGEPRDFFRHDYTAYPYKARYLEAPTYYLVGERMPERLNTQKFLGYAGIGYLKTDNGIYMSFRLEKSDDAFFSAQRWDDVSTTLGTAQFRLAENKLRDEFSAYYDREMRRLEGKRFSGACSEFENQYNELRKRDLNRQKEAYLQSRSGNVFYPGNPIYGYSDLIDPKFQLESLDMDTRIKICKAEDRMTRAPSREREQLAARVGCLNNFRLEIRRVKLEMDYASVQNASEPGQALRDKQRMAANLLGRSCN